MLLSKTELSVSAGGAMAFKISNVVGSPQRETKRGVAANLFVWERYYFGLVYLHVWFGGR